METFFEITPDDEALAAMTVEDAKERLKRLRKMQTDSGIQGISQMMKDGGKDFFDTVHLLHLRKEGKCTNADAERAIQAMIAAHR